MWRQYFMGRLWYIYTNMVKSCVWGVKCETKAQTCSWDSCHQGCPGSSRFCTRWSSETCSQRGRCHPLRPTAEHTHTHTLVWTVYTCQSLVKIKVQSSVLVNRRFPGHEAVTCGTLMPWLVPSYLWLIPNGHYFPNIVNEAHQLEPVCGGNTYRFVMKPVRVSSLSPWLPLSGCAWRMPSAVWKAWKELGKSTSGSDSSTSWSKAMMASIILICSCVQPLHSACCRRGWV